MNKKKEYYAEKRRKKAVEAQQVEQQLPRNEEKFHYKMTDYFDCKGFSGIAKTTLVCAKKKTKEEIEQKFINLYPFLEERRLK
jgi:hypothetical protein